MSKLDTNVDAWADALRGAEDADPEDTRRVPNALVERRQDPEDGTEPVVELRVRDAGGDVSSVALSPAEARTLAGQLRAAAADEDPDPEPESEPGHGDTPNDA